MSEWQPIETAPDDGTVFLAYVPGERSFYDGFWSHAPKAEPGVVMCRWDDYTCAQDGLYQCLGWTIANCNIYTTGHPVVPIQPTHWMPLSAPKEPDKFVVVEEYTYTLTDEGLRAAMAARGKLNGAVKAGDK